MIKAKLPEGITVEQAKGAMTLLAQDPNFTVLCKFIDTNDIEALRTELEGEGLDEKDAQRIRYRIKVMREFKEMPIKILNVLESETRQKEEKPQRERIEGDPYADESDEEA